MNQTVIGTIPSSDEIYMIEALAEGKKEWGRSKIMIVGEGRAGKTALANSILGRKYERTDSTIGINEFTCTVGYAEVNGNVGGWSELKDHKEQREYETAVARLILDKRAGRVRNEKKGNDEDEGEELEGLRKSGGYIEGEETRITTEQALIGKGEKPEFSKAHDGSKSRQQGKELKQNTVAPVDNSEKDNLIHLKTQQLIDKVSAMDKSLVMQYLRKQRISESKFVISVFDFGGQSVFNVIHPIFLTRFGVYVLVFNMEWLSRDASLEVREDCIKYIRFWLNSIIIHTQNEEQEIAPIFFVGTRKDVVSSPAEHLSISTTIYKLFSSSLAWPYVEENHGAEGPNGKTDLYFFPINNTLGNRDRTVVKLMKKIEDKIDGSSYVHVERPLSWFRVLDALKKQNVPFLQYEEAVKIITIDCGISEKIHLLLKFFHEMGIIMWHDEETLRDVVVLDPIEYFVKPATMIICKHAPDEADGISHLLEIHRKVRKMYAQEFQEMTRRGIVTENLLKALLQSHERNYPYIRQMMLKYGLLVPLTLQRSAEEGDFRNKEEEVESTLYLAPALLPESKDSFSLTGGSISTQFYFVFTSNELGELPTITLDDCRILGFLPLGLFEKLISKALLWSMKTSDFVSRSTLYGCYKNAAELAFGNQIFRVYADNRHNLISVVVYGENPVGIHDRLRDQLQEIISECLHSLKFVSVLRYEPYLAPSPSPSSDSVGASIARITQEQDLLFIRLSQVRFLVEKKTTLSLKTSRGRSLLGSLDAMRLYGPWLVDYTSLEEYDVFLSYRWGPRDSDFTSALYDRLSLYSLTDGANLSRRPIRTLLDKKRLEVGQNFQSEFVKSLASSLIMIPVVSSDALMRMTRLQGDEEDNLLIEWLCGLECVRYQSGRMNHPSPPGAKKVVRLQKIMPIFFGSSPEEGIIRDLFEEKVIDRLPMIVPTACMKRAKQLLESNGITISADFMKSTIKEIVQEITKYLFLCAWEMKDKKHITALVAEKIVPILNEELNRKQPATLQEEEKRLFPSTNATANTTSLLDGKKASDKEKLGEEIDYELAWSCVQPNKSKDPAASLALLDELGVASLFDFKGLDALKPAAQKNFQVRLLKQEKNMVSTSGLSKRKGDEEERNHPNGDHESFLDGKSTPINDEVKSVEDLKFPPLLRVSFITLKILIATEELKEARRSKDYKRLIEIDEEKTRLESWLEESSQGIAVDTLPTELSSKDFTTVKQYTIKQLEAHFEQCIKHKDKQLLARVDNFLAKVKELNLIPSTLPILLTSSAVSTTVPINTSAERQFHVFMQFQFHVFLTHNWANDESGRNNHQRVSKINKLLKQNGLTTWFDDDRMKGLIRHTMSNALYQSKIVLCFVTKQYEQKINKGSLADNCFYEFNLASTDDHLVNQRIAIAMEKSMLNPSNWERGRLKSELGGALIVDMTEDDDKPEIFQKQIQNLISTIRDMLEAINIKKKDEKK